MKLLPLKTFTTGTMKVSMTRLYQVLPFSLISIFSTLLSHFDFVWCGLLLDMNLIEGKKEENG